MKEFTHPKYPTIHIKLLKQATDFNRLKTIMPTSRASAFDLTAFIPETHSADSKYLYGIFDANKLIGVIDLIEDYPTKQATYIHEFFIQDDNTNEDLAQTLYMALEKTAQETGTTSFEIDETLTELPLFKEMGFKDNKKILN